MGKICNNCKHENKDTANFCSECGNSLTENKFNDSINTINSMGDKWKNIVIAVTVLFAILLIICIIAKSIAGIFFVLVIGIPIIIKLSFELLINKYTSASIKKSSDRYNEYIKNKK